MGRVLQFCMIAILLIHPVYADLPAGATIHQLDNGLQVLLIENHILPMTGVNVVVKTGSAYETFATSGMSHMLEHLLFNGTATRSQKELYDAVDLIGGYNNANTSEFYTNFMMVTPADKIREGMEIQADMLFNSILPEDKFDKEKGIVLEEIAQSISKPSTQLERNKNSVLYPGHALSLPTLGTYATIKSLKRDDVYRYYKNNYVPNNMIMNVIGNFDSGQMLKMIHEIYGSYRPDQVMRPDVKGWRTDTAPLPQTKSGSDRPVHRFYEGDMIQIHLFYYLAGYDVSQAFAELLDADMTKKADLIKENIENILPGQLSRVQTTVRTNPVAAHLEVTLTVQPQGPIQELVNASQAEIQKLRFSVSPEFVSYHITKARTDFLQNLEKPHMFGIYNAETFAIAGIEAVLNGNDASEYQKAAALLNTFKLDSKPLILINHPRFVSSATDTTSVANDKKYVDPESGLTLIVRQNPASQLLAIHMLFKHKARFESEYGKDAAKILHDCLEQRLTSPENQKISQKYGFTFTVNDNPYIPMDDIYLHPDFSYIRAEGLADDYSAAINYLNNQLANFRPSNVEYERAVVKFGDSGMMRMNRQKGQDIFNKSYEEIIYEPEKYAEGPAKPGYDQLVNFSSVFFTPANMIVSVVSPGKPAEIFEIYKNFRAGESPFKPETSSAYDRSFVLLHEPLMKEVSGGGDQAFLFWGYTREIPEDDKPALTALSLVLSDTIVFDIREKQGRAYRMRAGIDIGSNRALFYINLGTRPENVDPILKQTANFFNPGIVQSLTAEQLTKSLNMYIGRMMFRRLSSINQAYYLGHSLYFYNDINYDRNFHQELANVTLEQVKKLAEKYLTYTNTATVIVR